MSDGAVDMVVKMIGDGMNGRTSIKSDDCTS